MDTSGSQQTNRPITVVSLEAQEAKIRAMGTVQGAEIIELIVDGGESAKNLNRPLMVNISKMIEPVGSWMITGSQEFAHSASLIEIS